MDLVLHLSTEEEARLASAAAKEGLDPVELIHRLVNQNLPAVVPGDEQDPTLALLDRWDQEDAAMTSEEIEAAKSDFEEFKKNINGERARAGARLIYP